MTLLSIVIGAGVMAAISAYMLFKLQDLEEKDKSGLSIAQGFQVLFFFIIIANFILIGSAGYESRKDCSHLLTSDNVVNATTTYSYDYVCEERIPNASAWIYKLPIWLAYFSGLFVLIFVFKLLYAVIMNLFKGGKRG